MPSPYGSVDEPEAEADVAATDGTLASAIAPPAGSDDDQAAAALTP